MAGNQPTITGVWGLGQHGETAHLEIDCAIKTVLFFFPAFWATAQQGRGRAGASRGCRGCLRQEEEQGGCAWEQALAPEEGGSCPPRVFFPFSRECGCSCCPEGTTFKGSLVIFPPKQSRIIFPCPFVRPLSITEFIIFPLVSTHVPFLAKAWEDPCSQLWV